MRAYRELSELGSNLPGAGLERNEGGPNVGSIWGKVDAVFSARIDCGKTSDRDLGREHEIAGTSGELGFRKSNPSNEWS